MNNKKNEQEINCNSEKYLRVLMEYNNKHLCDSVWATFPWDCSLFLISQDEKKSYDTAVPEWLNNSE